MRDRMAAAKPRVTSVNWVLDLRCMAPAATGPWNSRARSLGAAMSYSRLFALALLVAVSVGRLIFGRDAAEGAVMNDFS